MPTGRYGKGCRPSPVHKVGLGHPNHLTFDPSILKLPAAADVPMPPPVDQLRTSSCTGNAFAVAVQEAMTRTAGLGTLWVPLPSRLFAYYAARDVIGLADQDDGAQIADVFYAASTLGVPPESAWTFSEDIQKITAMPDWKAIQAAADQRIVEGAWRILSSGQQRVTDVRSAIASGCPVVWGTELDQAFEDLGPLDVWPGVTGLPIGGHAMVLHRYEDDTFWTRSSWGASFADAGSARIASAAVASVHAADLWVVKMVPNYSGGVA